MRIIGGSLRGKMIEPPVGYSARPTTDFAREGLFNILGNEYDFTDLAVLDLFAGTGAISYEFASRGAGRIWCVEMQPRNAEFIRSQVRRFGLDNITVVRHNVFDFIDICKERFDIVFADPPYSMEGVETLPARVIERGLLYPGCYFILEHSGDHSFVGCPGFVKERKYGNVHFSFFEQPGE